MKWINVKDRLPDLKTYCLVWAKFSQDDKYQSYHAYFDENDIYHNYEFVSKSHCGCCGDIEFNEITHWMPLPKEPDGMD